MNIPKEIQDNLITYLEAARVALGDADLFDSIADQLDLADAEMIRLRDQLQDYLNQE
jgi:ATP phosphoribosyltransferase regulatory subunit HisZ